MIRSSVHFAFAGAIACSALALAQSTRPTTQPIAAELRATLDAVLKEMSSPSTDGTKSSQPLARSESDAMEALSVALHPAMKPPAASANDAARQVFAARAMSTLRDFHTEMPKVTVYLLDQNQRQRLTGDKLKLLDRLLAGQVQLLMIAVKAPPPH